MKPAGSVILVLPLLSACLILDDDVESAFRTFDRAECERSLDCSDEPISHASCMWSSAPERQASVDMARELNCVIIEGAFDDCIEAYRARGCDDPYPESCFNDEWLVCDDL